MFTIGEILIKGLKSSTNQRRISSTDSVYSTYKFVLVICKTQIFTKMYIAKKQLINFSRNICILVSLLQSLISLSNALLQDEPKVILFQSYIDFQINFKLQLFKFLSSDLEKQASTNLKFVFGMLKKQVFQMSSQPQRTICNSLVSDFHSSCFLDFIFQILCVFFKKCVFWLI